MNTEIDLKNIIDMEKSDKSFRIIQLCMGVDKDHNECYAYLSLIPSKAMEYAEKCASGEPFDLKEYGEILVEGTGSSIPPAAVQLEMKEKYGVDYDFENKMQAEIETLR